VDQYRGSVGPVAKIDDQQRVWNGKRAVCRTYPRRKLGGLRRRTGNANQ
jgi:hypothetical protein